MRALFLVFILLQCFCTNAQVFDWVQRAGASDATQGSLYVDQGFDVVHDQDGYIYVSGSYAGPAPTFDTISLSNPSQMDAFVAKYTETGEVVWVRTINGTLRQYADRVIVDSIGNIILACRIDGTVTFSNQTLLSQTQGTILLLKYNPNGDLLSYKRLFHPSGNSTFMNAIEDIEIASNGDYIFGGKCVDSLVVDTLIISDHSAGSYSLPMVFRMDTAFQVQWVSKCTITNSFSGYNGTSLLPGSLALDDNGNIYLAHNHNRIIVDTFSIFTNRPSHLIIKYSSTGDVQWLKTIKTTYVSSQIGAISIECLDSSLYVLGAAHMNGTPLIIGVDTLEDEAGSFNTFFLRFSQSGNFENGFIGVGSASNFSHLHSKNGQIYAFADISIQFHIGNLTSTLNTTTNGVFFSFDPVQEIFTEEGLFLGTGNGTRVGRFDFDNFGNAYFTGLHYALLQVDTFNLQAQGYSDVFIARQLDCSYINPEISILGDSVLCPGQTTTLKATADSSTTFQWYYNGSILSGQTDSILTAFYGGDYSVRATDGLCYLDSDPMFITPTALPSVINFSPASTAFCSNDNPVELTGGTPVGGHYSGPGVMNDTLFPSVSGIGNVQIQYVISDSVGCSDSTAATFNIQSAPNTVFFPSITSACTSDTVALTGGFPTGGVYSGNGVSSGLLFGSAAGIGNNTINYTFTNPNGCSASDSIVVTINQTPSVSFNWPIDSTCEASAPLTLNGNNPLGGIFSGTGVAGNFFIPGIVNPDNYQITYSFTLNGCTGFAMDSIQVDSFPSVVLPALDSICLSATSYNLDHGYPSGGTYIGAGISNNVFDASAVGVGVHNVMYVYENACSADTAYSTITVIPSPIVSAAITDVSCNGLSDGQIISSVAGGNGPYSFAWSNGDTSNVTSGLITGNYSVTVNDESGCLASNTFIVDEPNVLALALDSLDDVVCNGFNDGKAFVSTSGGTSPYSYAWSNGVLSEDATNLSFGTHQLVVTDANGCQDSLSVSISEVNPISLVGSSVDVTCTGFADGIASIIASGGGGLFSYAWSNGQSTASINSLDTGSYVIIVSDQNSCQTVDTFQIDQPDSLLVSLSATDLTCFESNDGTASATVLGGIGTYNYAWSNASTGSVVTSLPAGTFALSVTDANGCQTVENAIVNQPDSLNLTITESSSILCNGNSDGELTASTVGGTAPYSYAWSNGASSTINSNLTANGYAVTVTDANGCFKTANATLTEPSVLSIQIDSVMDVSCFGLNDGYAAVSASGGTGAITYLWNNGTAISNASALVSGSYSVSATDANGCLVDTSLSIAEPLEITLSVSSSDVNCFGGNDGQATVSASNGQGAFSYAWSNGNTSATNTSLTAQTYIVTVTDAAGCFKVDSAVIDEPTQLVSIYTASNNACFGDSTGQINAAVSGGTLPYAYSWSTGDTAASIDSLVTGSYAVTITDGNGCQVDSSFTLSQPTSLVLSIDSTSDLLCFNDSSGSIGASASGGTSAYAFLWNDGATLAIRTGITAGTYSVTLTDANGCEKDTSLIITEPALLSIQVNTVQDVLCFGDTNGSIDASSTGGTLPISYSWSNGQNTAQISDLVADNYTMTVTDINGCQQDTLLVITEPPLLIIQVNAVQDLLCFGDTNGSIDATSIGGTSPINYAWSNGENATQISSLVAGNYTLTATDDNGCIADSVIAVNQPDSISINASINLALCDNTDDGSIATNVFGGIAPYDYSWSTTETTDSIGNLAAGNYAVTISDANACESTQSFELEFQFIARDALLTSNTGYCAGDSVLLSANDSATYVWSTGSTASSIYVSAVGNYSVTIADGNGCFDSDTTSVVEYDLPEFELGNDTLVCQDSLINGLTLLGPAGLVNYYWTTGDISPSILVFNSGVYGLYVSDSNGCSYNDSIRVISDTCLSIEAVSSHFDISIFPNPTRGELFITSGSYPKGYFSIYNSFGQLIYQGNLERFTAVDISDFSSGMYHIIMSVEDAVFSKAIILQ